MRNGLLGGSGPRSGLVSSARFQAQQWCASIRRHATHADNTRPTDAECKAVVFQNYQEPFRYPFSKAVDQRLDKEGKVTIKVNDPDQKIDKTRLMGWPVAWYKAGFLLPKEIQSSRILMEKRVVSHFSNISVPLLLIPAISSQRTLPQGLHPSIANHDIDHG